jgi:hypothetical protein
MATPVKPGRHGLNGGISEKIDDRDVSVEFLPQPGMDADKKEGVSSQVEEIVPDPDAINAQDLRPDFR